MTWKYKGIKRRYKKPTKDRWVETKIAPRTWKMVYTTYSKKNPGYKVAKVNANQYAIKRTNNSYDLIMKGNKRIIR